ncbi:MAG: hypothetical protein BWX80_00838 [Candidatus Hydrogenedentes bacterium ADurb.Bin101]|nr:MAG: hypothetical protein BWX80_00838 [Candidatus Hydrogenedentes bacterium ADurb.Bin101]
MHRNMYRKPCSLFSIALMLAMPGAMAWGPSTHAYIASCVTGGRNLSVLFGAMLPDCNAVIRENAAEASALKTLGHRDFDRLVPSALKTGFMTHNAEWGADYYAHSIYSKTPPEEYSVRKFRQLSDEFGITVSQAEDVIEMCVDIQIRLLLGPSWGALIERAAKASGEAHEQALVDAYAAELAARVPGLSREKAETDIRMAVRGYKSLAATLGRQLQSGEEEIHAAIPPVLAMYLDCDGTQAATYYRRGLEITTDCMTEMDRICAAIKTHMPDAAEGEQEEEGETEPEEEKASGTAVVDFCQAFTQVHENPLLQGLDPEFAAFVELLNPATADLNGTFDVNTSGGKLKIEIKGNGVPDAANELGLLARFLNGPESVSLAAGSAVPDHETALAAWRTNLAQLDRDIGPAAALVEAVVPGLKPVLAGFLTLGDGKFTVTSAPSPETPDAPVIASGNGSFGLVAALFATLNTMLAREIGSGFANPGLQCEDYVTLAAFLPEGDADGDGFSNREEYKHATPAICAPQTGTRDEDAAPPLTYSEAALDSRIKPDRQ